MFQCYRDLTLVNRDGMNVILVKINQILMEKFLKLQDVARTQVKPHGTVHVHRFLCKALRSCLFPAAGVAGQGAGEEQHHGC